MKVSGSLRVPGDKSISHRSLILGVLGAGRSRITGILQSADVHSTASVLRTLGAGIPALSDDFVVHGIGARGLCQPSATLDCGNSGTTTRLMAGVVAALPVVATFTGDASLSRRPMRRVSKPLEAMGARFELPPHGGLPMTIHGGALHTTRWQSEVASAQVKSAILLAAVVAGIDVEVVEIARTRDHTERMLAARGIDVSTEGLTVGVRAGGHLRSIDTNVPGDPSSAAFFAALAALADEEGGELRLVNVCVNESRVGFLRQLERMGVSVRQENRRVEGGEDVADVVVSRSGPLAPATITARDVPAMVDELPMLACLAARADGVTEITGADELRVKESDRITAVVANLRAVGVDAEELPDGMRITGSGRPLRGRIVTHGDHRLAMAFGILGAARGNAIEVDDPDCAIVSYPGFWSDLARVRGGAA